MLPGSTLWQLDQTHRRFFGADLGNNTAASMNHTNLVSRLCRRAWMRLALSRRGHLALWLEPKRGDSRKPAT